MATPVTDWMADAACQAVDPELFFPTADAGPAYDAQAAAAKQVCAGCPVRSACLNWAIDHLSDGIAGGLDADKRRALRQARRNKRRRGTGTAA
jgi:Transcription factor WhiB